MKRPRTGRHEAAAMNQALQSVIPTHVAPDRVLDFDLYHDEGLLTDPSARMQDLLANAPDFFYTPRNGGHWVVIGKEAINEMIHLLDLFTTVDSGIPAPPEGQPFLRTPPLDRDPPDHGPLRALINPFLSPKVIFALEDEIRALSVELIEKVRPLGRCEFVAAFALPVPVLTFMKRMGMDLARYQEFSDWVCNYLDGDTIEIKQDCGAKMMQYLGELIRERQARPGHDWISQLLASRIDGRPVDAETVVAPICNLLFIAGLDTVKNGMCHFARILAARPDLQRRLREQPGIAQEAVEELLRSFGGTTPPRRVKRDGEFRGAQVKKGEPVIFYLPSVGIDAANVADPLRIDFDRAWKPHIAFGAGPHRCAGSHLARLELRIFLQEWMQRIPEFRIAPGTRPEFRPNMVNGVGSLHLVW
ncbi:MAG: cytochrome P450 [Gammaproteobacteria bacterium]